MTNLSGSSEARAAAKLIDAKNLKPMMATIIIESTKRISFETRHCGESCHNSRRTHEVGCQIVNESIVDSYRTACACHVLEV